MMLAETIANDVNWSLIALLFTTVATFGLPLAARAAVADDAGTAQRAAAGCLAGKARSVAVRGLQNSRYTADIPADSAVDAQTAMWLQTDNWPVSFNGGSGSCWFGAKSSVPTRKRPGGTSSTTRVGSTFRTIA